jgi:hypothetical protein
MKDRPGHVAVPRLVAASRQPVRHVNVPRSVYFHPRTRSSAPIPVPACQTGGTGLCAVQRTPGYLAFRRHPGETLSRGRLISGLTSFPHNRHRFRLAHIAIRGSRGKNGRDCATGWHRWKVQLGIFSYIGGQQSDSTDKKQPSNHFQSFDREYFRKPKRQEFRDRGNLPAHS